MAELLPAVDPPVPDGSPLAGNGALQAKVNAAANAPALKRHARGPTLRDLERKLNTLPTELDESSG
jgi:hypothetical protein